MNSWRPLSLKSLSIKIPIVIIALASIPFWIIALWGVFSFFSLKTVIEKAIFKADISKTNGELLNIVKDIQNAISNTGWLFLVESSIIAIIATLVVFFTCYIVYKNTKDVSGSFLNGIKSIKEGDLDVHIDGGKYDETMKVAAAIEEMASTIKEKNQALRLTIEELTIPATEIWSNVIFLPIVGYVDSRRASMIEDVLLEKVSKTKSSYVILDISGISAIDTQVIAHILRITSEIALLGAKAIFSGTTPQIAKSISRLGIDLKKTETFGKLELALKRVFTLLRKDIET